MRESLCLNTFWPLILEDDPEIALVLFHTTFNTLGVIAILPFTYSFARFMQKLVPEQQLIYSEQLNPLLLNQPNQALNAVQLIIRTELITLLAHINAMIGDLKTGKTTNLIEMRKILNATHNYVDHIHLKVDDGSDWKRLIAFIHTLDHMQRLHERCEEDAERAAAARDSLQLESIKRLLNESIQTIIGCINKREWNKAHKQADDVCSVIHQKEKKSREEIMLQIGVGQLNVTEGTEQLQAARWLRRVSIHIARITGHLEQAIILVSE